jgi:hypothetical protein
MNARAWSFGVAVVAVAFVGCRARGLPEPPPGQDPADPHAPVPAWRPAADPLHESAFPPADGREPKGRQMHEGHGHHHHGSDPEPSPVEQADDAPDNAEPSRPVEDGTPEAAPQ